MMSYETGESLTKKANAAFRQAATTVIDRARQTGTPIILWENGQVVKRTAEEMELLLRLQPVEAGESPASGKPQPGST
jgi:hypothetical protein